MQSVIKLLCALCALTLFFGCAKRPSKLQPPQRIVPEDVKMPKASRSPGSIYNGYDNLFSDAKAYNVGDVVTIEVIENLRGSGSTNTKTSRTHTMDLNFPSPIITDKRVPDKERLFGLNQESGNTFQGKGGTNRSARLIARISARVIKVYPNGNLFITGKKYIKINDDIQVLKISGIVRPVDIDADNSVDSSKISDMYVEYNGEGFMAQTQRPGWLANFLMKIWPF